VKDRARAAFAFSQMQDSGMSVVSSFLKSIAVKDVSSMDASSLFAFIRACGAVDLINMYAPFAFSQDPASPFIPSPTFLGCTAGL